MVEKKNVPFRLYSASSKWIWQNLGLEWIVVSWRGIAKKAKKKEN